MDEFEISSIWDAVTYLETADTLLYAFFEDYFEHTDYEELKFDAENRPELMTAKIHAVMEYIYKARIAAESAVDPGSELITFYLSQTDRLRQRVAKAEESKANG